jgi:ABC-type transport system involved in multi-copper enzyme maturation permease subunit
MRTWIFNIWYHPASMRKILAIARFTLLEAARSRLSWLVLGAVLVLVLASLLVRELAITDSQRLQLAFLASLLRATSALLSAIFIISSLQREFNDKVPTLLLALDLPRSHFVLGKAAGLSLAAMLIALSCAAPLALFAPAAAWWPWTLSLLLETAIVAAVALFCGISLRSVSAGLLFSVGFYVLAKSLAAIQLISHASLNAATLSQRYMTGLLDTLALLLPRLDQFAPTPWLVDGIATTGLTGLALQALIFVALATSAAMFDLYRKNL